MKPADEQSAELFDAIVIGTGFGGAVAACRLAEAGQRICILERGRRYLKGDFPRPQDRPDNLPDLGHWLWDIDQGIFDVKDLQGTLAVQAAGYGGGSLVYANVHLRPDARLFEREPGNQDPTRARWPAGYSLETLAPFYDLVAATIGVQPYPDDTLPKLATLRNAARDLGRSESFFKPPLAIDFDKCTKCGECIAGCNEGAKNTLDLNYLRTAERESAEVRTLAEVLRIHDRKDGGYDVSYRDHAEDDRGQNAKPHVVSAKRVFLCAGAINSTEIMLRSRNHLRMNRLSRDRIGQHFFTNGDALAMVYDTNVTPAPQPSTGPTITGTLLYNPHPHPTLTELSQRGPRPERDWFIIQDGGYPPWLASKLGLFRGSFWLNRNRVTESRSIPKKKSGHPEMDAAHESLETLLKVSRSRQSAGTIDAANQKIRGARGTTPEQVRQILGYFRQLVRTREGEEAAELSAKTMDEVAAQLIEHSSPWLRGLARFVVGLGEKRVSPHLRDATLKTLDERIFGPDADEQTPFALADLEHLAKSVLEDLFVGVEPGERAFIMLAMGVDSAPGRLRLVDDGRHGSHLHADWDLEGNMPFSSREECLVQDIAETLGGELRLNPDSVARQQPVSVHNLGGCSMSDDASHGVTDGWGKVWGSHGLYILDGSSLPGATGSNPSATIAAIAERNIRHMLETLLPPAFLGPPPIATEQRPASLDPLAQPRPAAKVTKSHPLGLKFTEVMRGTWKLREGPERRVEAHLHADIVNLNAFLADSSRSIPMTGVLLVKKTATAPAEQWQVSGQLELLKPVRSDNLHRYLLSASALLTGQHPTHPALQLAGAPIEAPTVHAEFEWLMKRIQDEMHNYVMAYDLTLSRGAATHRLRGNKTISGGPGLTAWRQTTTLPYRLYDGEHEDCGGGQLRVHLADLLDTQVPSFEVTHTTDAVRMAWAFGRFFHFFFGTLKQVYLPRFDFPSPFADRRP